MWVIDRMRMGPGQAAGWLRERGASGVGLAWRQSLLTVGGFHLHVKHLYFSLLNVSLSYSAASNCPSHTDDIAPLLVSTQLYCMHRLKWLYQQ